MRTSGITADHVPAVVLLVELLPDLPRPSYRFCMGTMSQIFQDRVFEEHVAFSRADRRGNVRNEMDMSAFLDFLLAWENRETPQAAKYFFKVLDIRGQGYLTQVGGGRLLGVCAGPPRGPGGACSVHNMLACGVCLHLHLPRNVLLQDFCIIAQQYIAQAVLGNCCFPPQLQVEIYIFFKAIYRMWVACGQYSELDPLDVKDELFDLVKPRHPHRITLQDLVVSAAVLAVVSGVTS